MRDARRSAARLLRAMQATGRGVSSWPNDLVTRLAHLDAVTARWLLDPIGSDPVHVEEACRELAQLTQWLGDMLSPAERHQVRRCQLQVYLAEDELHMPLLCPDDAPRTTDGDMRDYTLPSGIRAVTRAQLDRMATRLGLRKHVDGLDRAVVESHVLHLLTDDQMLGVLVATLHDDALEMLANLVRGELTDRMRDALASIEPVAIAVGAEGIEAAMAAATCLRDCGLAFARCPVHGQRLWVPVELQRRLDGVLRVFGL